MSKLPSNLPKNLGAKSAKAAAKPAAPKLKSVQSVKSKETIYIDVDDEITSIIEKVRGSKGGIVALVLPKRASMLQSVVNMRLLKRAADAASKNLVLVTTEASLLPLAGAVGLHTAASPTSKPIIPEAPVLPDENEVEDIEEPVALDGAELPKEDFDPKQEAATPVGALAGLDAIDEEVVESDDEPEETLASAAAEADVADETPKRDKKLAVPSFDSFKKRIALGIMGLLALIGLWYVAFVVMPHAVISLDTQTSSVRTEVPLNLDTATKELNIDQRRVPATAFSMQKNYTQQASATGQQNNGEKADGSVKMTTSVCSLTAPDPDDIPFGSSITSGGQTYITQEKGTFNYTGKSNGCLNYASNTVDITALKPGTAYNLGSNATFTIKNGVNGTGTASGGTDEIVKTVTQADIDGAKQKIASQDAGGVKQSLIDGLGAKGVKALPTTYLAAEPQITSSANAGDKADTITVNAVVTYSMLGVQESDLRDIIIDNVKTKIDPERQKITDDGLSKATFAQDSPATSTAAVVTMKTTSLAGPEIKPSEIKKLAAGKKAGEIKDELSQIPGVSKVDVKYSPFWVTSVPKNVQKIEVKLSGAE